MAEGQGFEPWKAVTPCWFSRPVHSTALPSLRQQLLGCTYKCIHLPRKTASIFTFMHRVLTRSRLKIRASIARFTVLLFAISSISCAMLAPVKKDENTSTGNESLNCTMPPISRCDGNQGCIESEMKECYRAWFTKAPPVTEGFHKELVQCFVDWREDNPNSNEESEAWRLCLHTLR
jgi:hypothetical protein